MIDIYLVDNGTAHKLEIEEESSMIQNLFRVVSADEMDKYVDNVSHNISIKGTKKNSKILGSIENLNKYSTSSGNSTLYNFSMSKGVECMVFENDTLISKGIFKVINWEIVNDVLTYNCIIQGYKSNFFNQLKNSVLGDLDYSELNHVLDASMLGNSWNNQLPYVYPLIDYGGTKFSGIETQINWDYRNLRPAIKLSTYFNKIFKNHDYSYKMDGDFEKLFNTLIIPSTASTLVNRVNYSQKSTFIHSTFINYPAGEGKDIETKKQVNNQLISWLGDLDNFTLNSSVKYPENGTVNSKYTAKKGIRTPINAKFTLKDITEWYHPETTQILRYDVKVTLLVRDNKFSDWKEFKSSTARMIRKRTEALALAEVIFKDILEISTDGEFSFKVTMDNFDFSDVLHWNKAFNPVFGEEDGKKTVKSVAYVGEVVLGDTTQNKNTLIDIDWLDNVVFSKELIPAEIKQNDLIKSVMQIFNLVSYSPIENPKEIHFATYDDYYKNTTAGKIVANASNWTNKIDHTNISGSPINDVFKNYEFTFKGGEKDYLNKDYQEKYDKTFGNFKYTTGNSSVTSHNKIEVIFSPTPVAQVEGNIKQHPMIFDYGNDYNKLSLKTNIRLLSYKKELVEDERWNIGKWFSKSANEFEFESKYLNISTYPKASTLYYDAIIPFELDLNFGTPEEIYFITNRVYPNLFDTYLKGKIDEMNDPNSLLIKCKALLNTVDIGNLNLSKPIFLDAGNGHAYFKVIEINYLGDGQLSDLILQRINI